MRVEPVPATMVLCCDVPHGIRAGEFSRWAGVSERFGTPVSWVTRSADVPMVIDVLGGQAGGDIALALDASHLASRPALRHEIVTAKMRAAAIGCAVASGTPALDHRALLVELGIHTLAVGGFDIATRRSRRPPPAGWPCRSVVWGLWEVRSSCRPPRPMIGRLMPWALGARPAPGSLNVLHVAVDLDHRGGLARLERLAAWIDRQRGAAHRARLVELPELLRTAAQRETGSVLKRAA